MLARYKPPKLGLRESAWWRSERHLRHVRKFRCVVPGCANWPTRACHDRNETDGCTGRKPSDFHTFPACDAHHAEQHSLHEGPFEQKYGISLKKAALECTATSPCRREIEEWKRTHARAA